MATRTEKGKSYKYFQPVGWKFIAFEDVEVCIAPLAEDFKHAMDCEIKGYRTVKKGEEFSLNRYETMELITRAEYNGIFTGNGFAVFGDIKRSEARVDSKGKKIPMVALKFQHSVKSVKDYYEIISEENEDGTYQVKSGFEIFAVYDKVKGTAAKHFTEEKAHQRREAKCTASREFFNRVDVNKE
jgi:hypothetical protein